MASPPRDRADVLLVRRGLADTRAKAHALILAGRVFSGERRIEKAGDRIETVAELTVLPGPRWVGRGGEKLDGALRRLPVPVDGRLCLDVGASTGGFTQVLLARGAPRVAALDVGRGQLDWSLRNDPRVAVIEGVNARHLAPDRLPFVPSLAVVDVSFISLALVVPAIVRCLVPGGEIVALVKPQFEAGRGSVGSSGVVRDPAIHLAVLRRIAALAREHRWGLRAIVPSPLRGAEGNVEFFVHLRPGEPPPGESVEAAWLAEAVLETSREGK